MTSMYGKAKQNLGRSRWHCKQTQDRLAWIYDTFVKDHPEFAERVFVAAATAKELESFLASIQEHLSTM